MARTKTLDSLLPATTTAYKGYLIHAMPFDGNFRVSKDNSHISYAPTLDDAKSIIDMLVN